MSTESNLNSLVDNIDKIIKQIESDINRSNVNTETIKLLEELDIKRKELFGLKENSKEFRQIKKKYGTRILTLKKSLMFYYNSNVTLMIYMQKEIKSNIESITYLDEKRKLLEELNSIKIPELYNKNINNFQDSLNVNFSEFIHVSNQYDKLRKKLSINDDASFGLIEIGYISRYAIPKINELIEKYNNGEKNATKQSINIDIILCKVKTRDIERKYKDNNIVSVECLKVRNTLDELGIRVSNSKIKASNKEYYLLKEKIEVFIQELNSYKLSISSIDNIVDIEEFKHKYTQYKDDVEKQYKHSNVQLYNNLIRYLSEAEVIINKIEIDSKVEREKPKTEAVVSHEPAKAENIENTEVNEKEEDGYYRVESMEEANDFYKRYNKPIMLASAVASMALVNTRVGPVLIPPIIFANIVAAYKYPIIDKINEILEKTIDAKRDLDKRIVVKRNGIKLGIEDALNGLLRGIALLGEKKRDIVNDLTTRVRNSAIVVKTNEYANRLRKTYNVKKQELFDLKVIKLYYEFILSDMTLEDFCKEREISDEVFYELVDYMQYKISDDRGPKRK